MDELPELEALRARVAELEEQRDAVLAWGDAMAKESPAIGWAFRDQIRLIMKAGD